MAIPRVVLFYGLAGLIPFLGLPLLGWSAPSLAAEAGRWQALYGALILSFLGGARWGQAVQQPAPDPLTVSLAMLPSLFGWGALLSAGWLGLRWALLLLAAALLLHWLWDGRSPGLPTWYPRLRAILTLGAVTGLVASALMIG